MNKNLETSKLSIAWDKIWFETAYGFSGERKIRAQEKIDNLLGMGLCFEKGQKVLDGGCGLGINLILLAKMFKVTPFGIDISKNILKIARKAAADSGVSMILKRGDVRAIPFFDGSFDVVMSWGVIEHFPQYKQAIREFHRVLKPRGTLNLVQPNKFSLRHIKRFYLELTGKWEFGMQINFSSKFLKKLLYEEGFQNVRFVVKPYLRSKGVINSADAWLNKLNKNWGYYLYILADKEE